MYFIKNNSNLLYITKLLFLCQPNFNNLSKFEEDVIFEYHITIQDDGFNLGLLTIRTPEGIYQTDFDA